MAGPLYHVEVWDMTGANFGPGKLLADFTYGKNIGYADYLLDVPEAFFTITQDDAHAIALSVQDNLAHVKIYRDADLVWAGLMGEWDANENDVIIYCYGYLAILFFMLSAWNVLYTNAQIDTIVSDLWTSIKTTLTSSLLGWITTGTIQAPVTTSGGATPIVLPTYRMFYKRALIAFRELAAIGIGNTTNTVKFEITPTGTFNYWKNRGADLTTTWEWGNGVVVGFGDSRVPIFKRNDMWTVGMNPNAVAMKVEQQNAGDITTNGRRMEPVFFAWVRDSTELDRVGKLRLARAMRKAQNFSVRFAPNSMIPPYATGSAWSTADGVNVIISRGITQVNRKVMIEGYQVLYVQGNERVRVLLADPLS